MYVFSYTYKTLGRIGLCTLGNTQTNKFLILLFHTILFFPIFDSFKDVLNYLVLIINHHYYYCHYN